MENFCREYIVRPGLSYVDYVRRELPKQAVHEKNLNQSGFEPDTLWNTTRGMIEEKSLVAYGNRFSRFYYGREYKIQLPDADLIGSVDRETARIARGVILYALFVRESKEIGGQQDTHDLIRSYIHSEKPSPQLFQYLRRILGQTCGPNIATLLATLPKDYLNVVQTILGYYTEQETPARDRASQEKHIGNIPVLLSNN